MGGQMCVTPVGVLGSHSQTTKVFPGSPGESLNSQPRTYTWRTQATWQTDTTKFKQNKIDSYNIVTSRFAPPLLHLPGYFILCFSHPASLPRNTSSFLNHHDLVWLMRTEQLNIFSFLVCSSLTFTENIAHGGENKDASMVRKSCSNGAASALLVH